MGCDWGQLVAGFGVSPYRSCPTLPTLSYTKLNAGDKEEVETKREFSIDNLLVRIHLIIVLMWWIGLAPWEFEFPFRGSLTSTFLTLPHPSLYKGCAGDKEEDETGGGDYQ